MAEKGGRYTVTGAYLHESFFELRTDVVRFYAACAAAELTRVLAVENERYEATFIGLLECLKGLCLSGDDPEEALISFLLIALHESGYPIDLGYFEECDGELGERIWFDFSDGRFGSFERCETGAQASVSTYHVLRKCAGLDFDESKTEGGKKRALRLLKAYFYEKTESACEALGELIRLCED